MVTDGIPFLNEVSRFVAGVCILELRDAAAEVVSHAVLLLPGMDWPTSGPGLCA